MTIQRRPYPNEWFRRKPVRRKPMRRLLFRGVLVGLLGLGPCALLADEKMEAPKPEKDRYPTLQYPPGFYQGGFFVSIVAGRSLAPGGSYIRHEKEYDHNLALQLQQGQVANPMSSEGGLPSSFDAQYTPGYSGQVELEYGTFPHVGFGFTMTQFSIKAERQDVILSSRQPALVTPVPVATTLYRGTSATGLATYHFFEKSVFDPYVALRAGMVGFAGEAHAANLPDSNRLSNKVQNGLGAATGLGLGVNIHMTREFGIKAEAAYHKQYLKSDQFSSRTLDTVTAQVGIIVNTTRLFPD